MVSPWMDNPSEQDRLCSNTNRKGCFGWVNKEGFFYFPCRIGSYKNFQRSWHSLLLFFLFLTHIFLSQRKFIHIVKQNGKLIQNLFLQGSYKKIIVSADTSWPLLIGSRYHCHWKDGDLRPR